MTQFIHDLKSQDVGKTTTQIDSFDSLFEPKNDVCKIVRGVIASVDTGVALSARHCIEIGHQAMVEGYYYQAINWMETAIAKIRLQNDTTSSLAEAEIQFKIAKMQVTTRRFIPNHNTTKS